MQQGKHCLIHYAMSAVFFCPIPRGLRPSFTKQYTINKKSKTYQFYANIQHQKNICKKEGAKLPETHIFRCVIGANAVTAILLSLHSIIISILLFCVYQFCLSLLQEPLPWTSNQATTIYGPSNESFFPSATFNLNIVVKNFW